MTPSLLTPVVPTLPVPYILFPPLLAKYILLVQPNVSGLRLSSPCSASPTSKKLSIAYQVLAAPCFIIHHVVLYILTANRVARFATAYLSPFSLFLSPITLLWPSRLADLPTPPPVSLRPSPLFHLLFLLYLCLSVRRYIF